MNENESLTVTLTLENNEELECAVLNIFLSLPSLVFHRHSLVRLLDNLLHVLRERKQWNEDSIPST